MPSQVIDFRPPGLAKPRPNAIKPGSIVTWTDPVTKAEWPELVVEFVYTAQRTALCHGCFGRMGKDGSFKIEGRPLPLRELKATGFVGDAA